MPCCTYSKEFPKRRTPDGRVVRSYEELIAYIQSKVRRVHSPLHGALFLTCHTVASCDSNLNAAVRREEHCAVHDGGALRGSQRMRFARFFSLNARLSIATFVLLVTKEVPGYSSIHEAVSDRSRCNLVPAGRYAGSPQGPLRQTFHHVALFATVARISRGTSSGDAAGTLESSL